MILSIFLQDLIVQQYLIVRQCRQLHSYRLFFVGCGLPQFLMLFLHQTIKKALRKTSVYRSKGRGHHYQTLLLFLLAAACQL